MTLSLRPCNKVRPVLLLAGLAAMGAAANACADIYRWTDKNGDLHYSNVMPSEQSRSLTLVTKTSAVPAQPASTQHELVNRVQGL